MSENVLSPTAGISEDAYQALQNGAVIQRRPQSGLLVLSDADRQDFLHRMTTNEIDGLKVGQSTVTILTSPTARTEYVFTVVCRSDDLWLLPAVGETEALARNLKRKIFFMDAVKVVDDSAAWTRMRLMGARAGEVLTAIGIDLSDKADGTWVENDGVVAVKQTRFDLPGYELLAPVADAESLLVRLTDAGALPIDEATYRVARIEAGRPIPGAELTDTYNPLESGMAWVCADDKGCYTGQEIIARQVNYDKITKSLVGLICDEAIADEAEVQADGRNMGRVTSTAYSPALTQFIALAIIKRPANEPGTEVSVDGHPATVVPLPFDIEYSVL
jgi:folate-binding protein YgfZ